MMTMPMGPTEEAAYALDFGVSRSNLSLAAQLEYDRMVTVDEAYRTSGGLKAERARTNAAAPPIARATVKQERTPSGILVLGALLGWGPWSAAIGAWQAYGNSGYTINGNSASTSAAHSVCQAGQVALQPGICGSIDAHYTFGVAMLIVGALAFIGGMIGLFSAQQHNPRAWRQAGGPIIAGLLLGIFAVAATVIVAIARGVREGANGPSTVQAQPANTTVSPEVRDQLSEITSTRQMNAQWRVNTEGGWEWLASDGQWYPQQLAPAGLLPPAPPPPPPYRETT